MDPKSPAGPCRGRGNAARLSGHVRGQPLADLADRERYSRSYRVKIRNAAGICAQADEQRAGQ